jgi:hypothetical protein
MDDILLQVKAPRIPDSVTTMLIRANAAGFISRLVFAKRIAVPLIVAMPSESKNQAARNCKTSLNSLARMRDFPSDFQE